MQKKIVYIIISLVAVMVFSLIIFCFYFKPIKEKLNGQPSQFGIPQIKIEDIASNPMKEAPSTNPLGKLANPFEDNYKNPFAEN